MPFKRGVAPIRRTIKYLESGPLVFKDRVKIMTVNFSEMTRLSTRDNFDHHKGAQVVQPFQLVAMRWFKCLSVVQFIPLAS